MGSRGPRQARAGEATWEGLAMNTLSRNGGLWIAIGTAAGVLVGVAFGMASVGLALGLVLGIAGGFVARR
jgi:hypothetical protein